MSETKLPFHRRAHVATRTNQREMAQLLGLSRRTISRWVSGQSPGPSQPSEYARLARAAYPNDRAFAAECAALAGTTLEALGLEVPPPPPAPPVVVVAPPPLPPPPPKPVVVTPAQADAVVCAAADVNDVAPREVRALVAAAFARAHELGFPTEAVAKALAQHLPSGKAKKG